MKNKNIIIILLTIASTIFIALSSFLYKQNIILDKRITERDSYLESLIVSDSLISQDSVLIKETIKETEFIVGDKVMSADEFIDYVKALYKEFDAVYDSLLYYRQYYKMSKKIYKNQFGVDSSGVYTFSYNALDTLSIKQIGDLLYDREKLKAIIERYDINIKEIDSRSFIITAPKIDSALILLPYYRHKLEHIPEKNMWVITHEGIK